VCIPRPDAPPLSRCFLTAPLPVGPLAVTIGRRARIMQYSCKEHDVIAPQHITQARHTARLGISAGARGAHA
jgi:hypothetical protein